MLETNELKEPHTTLTSRTVSSSSRTSHVVSDLLDFTRSKLGDGIPVVRAVVSSPWRSKGDTTAGEPIGKVGLGLYIPDRIANAHGGRIDVESSEARGGTTFTVHLPRQDARATG